MQRSGESLVLDELHTMNAIACAADESGCSYGAGASHVLCANALDVYVLRVHTADASTRRPFQSRVGGGAAVAVFRSRLLRPRFFAFSYSTRKMKLRDLCERS